MDNREVTKKQKWMRYLCLFLVLWILMGMGLITIFIFQKNLMAIVLTAVIFCSSIQVVYWYCRIKILQVHRRQIRNALLEASRNRSTSNYDPENDKPPTYEEIMKSDPPPPAYYEIVTECFGLPNQGPPSYPAESPETSIKSKAETTPKSGGKRKKEILEPVHQPNNINRNLEMRTEDNVVAYAISCCHDNQGYLGERRNDTSVRLHARKQHGAAKEMDTSSVERPVGDDRIQEYDNKQSKTSGNKTTTSDASASTSNDPLSTIRAPITRNVYSSVTIE